jgi:hypothetical protein
MADVVQVVEAAALRPQVLLLVMEEAVAQVTRLSFLGRLI